MFLKEIVMRRCRNETPLRPVDSGWDYPCHSAYLCTNTSDPDFDIDGSAEFKDVDDEHYGLSIVEFDNILEQRLWLIGAEV